MSENEYPAVRTAPTLADYVRALVAAWPEDEPPVSKGACAVLWAQFVVETGGGPKASCFGWNIGNVKHVAGDGHDWHALRGVWEGVAAAEAARMVAAGEAVYDTNEAHKRAVAPLTAIVLDPSHPGARFRRFPSLDVAMVDHVKLLRKRFRLGWPGVLAGDFVRFAEGLKAQRYFTATSAAYVAAGRDPFAAAMASDAYDIAIGIANDPRPEPDMGGIVHGKHVVEAALAEREESEPNV
jgi:hypothetical protein